MTVDPIVPNGDITVNANVLIISEEGGMEGEMLRMRDRFNMRYFQRLPGDTPYIFPEESGVEQVDSWRPYITWADMIIVDNPAFVAKLDKDFALDAGTMVVYKINNKSYEEVSRLMHWLNPVTVDALKEAMVMIDAEPEQPIEIGTRPISLSKRIKRLFRRNRA